MTAAIITIGDEILIGQIIDTNSGYIAKALDKIGISVTEMLSISDNKDQILNTFRKLQNEVDFVFITGGLGPTKDDITKKTFCTYFNDHLIENKAVLAHVKEMIERVQNRPITQLNIEQALLPSKATVLFNKVGTAPGMWLQKENTVYISLPGVPYEMKYLVSEVIVPKIVADYKRPFIVHQTIMTYGKGESWIAELIEEWEDNLPEFIKLAYLPAPGRVRLRLSAKGIDEAILKESIKIEVDKLDGLIGEFIVGYNEDESIEVAVADLLKSKGFTISTAESCTLGQIGYLLGIVPGASAYYKGTVVAYDQQVKTSLLHVSEPLLRENGVVSEAVAVAMAQGVRAKMNSTYGIATTGNAGPSKGDENKELGVVCIAIATENEVVVEEFNFGQPREKVVDRAVNKALEMLRKEILKN